MHFTSAEKGFQQNHILLNKPSTQNQFQTFDENNSNGLKYLHYTYPEEGCQEKELKVLQLKLI